MELRDYLHLLRRRWAWIVATAAVVLAASAAITALATPQYEAKARLFVTIQQGSSASDVYQGGLFSVQRVASYADLAETSADLAEVVIRSLELTGSTRELLDQVSARVVRDTVNLEVSVTDPDPLRAQLKTQAYAEALVDMIRQLETPTDGSGSPVRAAIVDPATMPTEPVSPNPVQNLSLGLVVGLVLGVGVALLREMLDTSVDDLDDIKAVTDAPILGSIPFDSATRLKPLVTSLEAHAPRVEAFRVLRTNLQFIDVDAADKVFVVTSALPEEGKSTTAVNLALTMAQAGHRTLLLEADLRRPKATAALGLDHAIGVTTVLLGKVHLDDALQQDEDCGLSVLASGPIPPNPAELLQSHAMADLLRQIRDRFDMVIIDAPPLLPVTDAALLAAQADGAVLVVRHGRTTKAHLAQAVSRLHQVDTEPLGVVLNMVPDQRRSYGYGYGYGYGPEPPTPPTAGSRRRIWGATRA